MKVDQTVVAYITGASSGFGREVALDLLKVGAKCYLTDRDDNDSQQLIQKYPGQVIFRKLDITDEEGVKQSFEECVQHFKYISVVVSCAGVGSPHKSILDPLNTSELLKTALKINVVGSFIIAKYAALQLVKQQLANQVKQDYLIINFSSASAFGGYYGMVNYSASKGGVLGMTLPMARDLGKFGIRVVTFTPGFFLTKMGLTTPPEVIEQAAKLTAMGRNGDPSELSAAVLGVMESSFLTGTHFMQDSINASL